MQRAAAARYNRRMARRKIKRERCDVAMLVDAETGERRQSGRFVPDRGSMEQGVYEVLRARYPRRDGGAVRPRYRRDARRTAGS